MSTSSPTAARPRRGPATRVAAVVTALLMVVALWLYSSSGLVAPGWAVAVLLVLWVGFAALAVVVHRRRGAVSLAVPLLALAMWFVVITLGEMLLGWTG